MSDPATVCIVCGGDHRPGAAVCDDAGMDRQIKAMGARAWNRITAAVMRARDQSISENEF